MNNDVNLGKEMKTAAPSMLVLGAAAVALLALIIGVAAWWESRESASTITQRLGGKIAELDQVNREVVSKNDALLRDMRDAQNRLAQLEAKLAEYQNQRVAIEEMTRDLARAPEDWLLAEIEQTLNIASRELTLAGNVRAAIAALQSADQRLSRADKLQATPLRRAITQDLERLKATPAVDTQGIIVKLDNLMTQSATLPLAIPASMVKDSEQLGGTGSKNQSWLSQAWADFVGEMKDLVRIREIEPAEAALITPQQSMFVRESVKLRLLSARTSLLARDETNFKDDAKAARELIAKYFDPKAKANQNAIATLKMLGENPVSIAAPDIVQSMNAIRAARAARETRESRQGREQRAVSP
jgi:uroporphyrin-III C-methyltransferase